MGIIFRGQEDSDVVLNRVSGSEVDIYKAARLSYDGDDEPTPERLKSFISKLFSQGHMVPFEHCSLTYTLKAPIFVFRQLFRYRTAIISEKSLRYCEAIPEFYLPTDKDEADLMKMRRSIAWSYDTYMDLVDKGWAREQARGALPLSTFSSAFFTMNLRNLFHLWDQRIDKHAQEETRFIAGQMFEVIKDRLPIVYEVYKENRSELFSVES